MNDYVKLKDLADDRGESSAKVARTLVRLGCDLYLHIGPSRKSRSGVSFYHEHPTERREHDIGPGNHKLTKDSQEAFIKRLDRGDNTTKGLFVLIYWKLFDPPETVEHQIELTEEYDSVYVVVDSDDLTKLPPPVIYRTAPGSMYPTPHEKKKFENSEKRNHFR